MQNQISSGPKTKQFPSSHSEYASSVLVIIVSANDGIWLPRCFEALHSSSHVPSRIVLVDNLCTDDSIATASRSALLVDVMRTANRVGFASANNLALQKAIDGEYRYVYLLNPDTIIDVFALDNLVRFLDGNRDYGVAGSLQYTYDSSNWTTLNEWSENVVREAANMGKFPSNKGGFTVLDHYYVQGASMLFRADLMRKVGILDPVYKSFYEETDFCRRSILHGLNVGLVFDSKIRHFGGGNWRKTRSSRLSRDRLFLRNQLIFYLSLPMSIFETVLLTLKLIFKQIRTIHLKQEHVTLPAYIYPLVILAALVSARAIKKLRYRNAIIAARAGEMPRDLMAIGEERPF